jgi:hypothetical protein
VLLRNGLQLGPLRFPRFHQELPSAATSDGSVSQLLTADSLGLSAKLLLAFASTVIPGFSLLEIHDQDFYSLLDMYAFCVT